VINDQGPEVSSVHRRIGSLSQAADFQRLLAVRPRAKTAHFVVHHLASSPTTKVWTPKVVQRFISADTIEPPDLSTVVSKPVDNSSSGACDGVWLGVVIPKKQAKRAVTRNLVRRQMRAAADRHLASLCDLSGSTGLWLLRLKQGFSRAEFPSADSLPLRRQVRQELDHLFLKALQPATGTRRA